MSWTALVPFKAADWKSRLSTRLSPKERAALARSLFDHVASVLAQVPAIVRIALLAAEPLAGWKDRWVQNRGKGLNVELDGAFDTLSGAPLMVVHADLPMLTVEDVEAITLAAGQAGVALAPDRHQRDRRYAESGIPFQLRTGKPRAAR